MFFNQSENEIGVVIAFAQAAQKSGFEIVRIGSEFPDATIKRDDKIYRAEFEYRSSNFRQHGHDPRECDLVICWKYDADCGGLPVLELSHPDWMSAPIEVPSDEIREVAYWRWRAERAEHQLTSAHSQLEALRVETENAVSDAASDTLERHSFNDFEQAITVGQLILDGLTGQAIGRWAGVSDSTGRRWKRSLGVNGDDGHGG